MPNGLAHISELLLRFHRGNLSASELRELEDWRARSEENAALYRELTEEIFVQAQLKHIGEYETDPVRKRILAQIPDAFTVTSEHQLVPRRSRWTWMAAAAIFLVLLTGTWLWMREPRLRQQPVAQSTLLKNDVLPGGNKAVLTLAGGQRFVLDSTANGALAQQGGASITKTDSGKLIYSGQKELQSAVVLNTLSTPRGGQYQLTLSDGTRVWLNAASSITYPTAFTGEERKVTITGEVYLEVKQNAHQSFKVEVAGAIIDVLGTRFNVNAYPDEMAINTTLLEGKVRVQAQPGSVILFTGQQAQVKAGAEKIKVVPGVDIEQVIAWKAGLFSFKDADLYTVMRQLSRWYNVEVRYNGNVQPVLFSGEIGRNLSLANVLSGLEQQNVHFKIEEDKRILILP